MSHIGIVSYLFDRKPEGICTGRLVRTLLNGGHRVTVFTSKKALLNYQHPQLSFVVKSHKPRKPAGLLRRLARLQGNIPTNQYLWSQRIARLSDQQMDLPDVIYGRAWPHSSVVAAYGLAKNLDLPLLLHFSDPFPPPNEDHPGDQFLQDLQQIVDYASAITFTNTETITYQKKFLGFEDEFAYVLNHVAPPRSDFGAPPAGKNYYYLGSIGPPRPLPLLLDGFKLHLQVHPDARLHLVGSNPKHVKPEVQRLGLQNSVVLLPFTQDTDTVMARANGLISVDANIQTPVFTPTKIVEYLMTDRPILALTPKKSPVDTLLDQCKGTAIAVTDYTAASIATGFNQLATMGYSENQYRCRLDVMKAFSPDAINSQLNKILAQAGILKSAPLEVNKR